MGIERIQTPTVEGFRLPAGGSYIITDELGNELFRVTADGDAVKVAGVAIDGGGGQTADVQAALDGAASPSAGNVFATMADAGGAALSDATPVVESGAGSAGVGTDASRDDHVHPEAGGAGALLSITVDLSAADIATLSSVPVEVVAAPGANKVIVPVAASFQYKGGTTPFYADPDPNLAVGNSLVLGPVGLADVVDTVVAALLGGPAAIGDDEPLVLAADSDPLAYGSILTCSVGQAGTGYAPGDTGVVDESLPSPATYAVDTVGGSGEVLTFHITDPGGGTYIVGDPYQTTVVTGSGDGFFSVSVDTITPASDGTARVTVAYYVMDLLV